MFAKFYQSELTYLRELGREFAAAHPSSAGLLAERSDDPDVERLLEGFAFLAARIRERVDDAVPEIVHGLVELLLPQHLRPVPATSIIEFRPVIEQLRSVRQIPRGTAVASNPVDGSACTFSTCFATDLLPLALVGLEHDEAVVQHPVIRVALRTTESGRSLIAREQGIRLFVAGEFGLAATVHLWLLRHCNRIEVRNNVGASSRTEPIRVLGPEQIHAVGLDEDQALLPWPKLAPVGSRFIQEYFALPSKFLFVDVRGLAGLEFGGDTIELAFVFDRPPALPAPLGQDTLRLHCTPVVNLFAAAAEPLAVDPLAPEQELRAAGHKPRHIEVFTVDSVIGVRPGRGNRRSYTNFYGFQHAKPGHPQDGYYVVRRSRSAIDDATDTAIRIARPRTTEIPDADETLSIELTCTNRSLPIELQIGDICKPVRGSAAPEFSNVTAVRPPVRAPLASELQWRLLAQLAIHRRRVTEPETLRLLLSLHEFSANSGSPVGRANLLRIEAIRTTESRLVTRILAGAPVRGTETTIELDEARFASIGDAHLFAMVLDELLASYCGLNSFHILRVRLHPSKVEFRCQARNGQHTIF